MGFKAGDEIIEVEAELEAETAKAYLIKPTSVGPDQCWVPKSQCHGKHETANRGVFIFMLTEWIAEKNGLI